MSFVSLRSFFPPACTVKAGTRSLQTLPGSRGWAHSPGRPRMWSSACDCSVPRDAQTCQAAVENPMGSHPHLSPTLRNQGQERWLRERWSQGSSGAWTEYQAPTPAVWGCLASNTPAVLAPNAPKGCTSPLLTQQPFHLQENPSFPLPQPTSADLCAGLARVADPLEQLWADPDARWQHIPQL